MTQLIGSQMMPKEQKIRFQGIALVFLASTPNFCNFTDILIFFLNILLHFGVLWHRLVD